MSLIQILFGTPEQNTRSIILHILLAVVLLVIFGYLGLSGIIPLEQSGKFSGSVLSTAFWCLVFIAIALVIGFILRRIYKK